MRASWKGSISFGLVSIPVKAYNTAVPKEIKFTLLHSKDGGRIRYRKFCEKCGEEVKDEEITRSYEISKNEYVILTDEDLEKIPLKSAKSIDIKQFFEPSELGLIYYSQFYYLVPDKGSEKAYYLLKEAMRETKLMGIGKIATRGREGLVALKEFDGGILLANLHYIDEVRSPKEIAGWDLKADISKEELELAIKLVLAMKKPLKLEEFRNEYKEALMRLIEAKLAGREVVVTEEIPTARSLMDALKASLEAVK
ncbi:MAG: Ku protein [Archaeoglobi archaeon]|nr:MAG: Ku protein [Archaeoglobi archaeon]TDA26117.1 MAG: Ku protein [Archaeoglobi archaeon]